MRNIAFLTSSNMVQTGPDQRKDAYEHEYEFALFQQAAKVRGLDLHEIIWDAPDIHWADFCAVLVGTTWDYVQKREQFYQVMAQIAAQTKLLNPLSILQMNGDKGYLLDLAAKGIATIPTLSVDKVTPAQIKVAFEQFNTDQLVIKPKVGAGAWRQVLLAQDDKIPPIEVLPPAHAFLQPFLPSIQQEGELSLLFYDGEYSHGIRKIPTKGEYRIQSNFGGTEQKIEPSNREMQLAQQALAALDEMPLYARVDIITGRKGDPLLIELEMIEPYHYVEQGQNCGNMLMDALIKRLD